MECFVSAMDKVLIVDDHIVHSFVSDILLFLFLLNSMNEGMPDNLSKIREWIVRLLWFKTANILNTVFYSITNHLFLVGIVHEVWLVGQFGGDLVETFADIVRDARILITRFFCFVAEIFVFLHFFEETLVINVVRTCASFTCHNQSLCCGDPIITIPRY